MHAPLPNPSAPADRPMLAISMGDPLGIGPECVVKALADPTVRELARYRIFGQHAFLERAARAAGIAPFWNTGDSAPGHEVRLTNHPEFEALAAGPTPTPGPTKLGGAASYRFVEAAIAAAKLLLDDPNHADAIVTAPISKTSWNLAGVTQFPGHTELLAERFNSARSGMLFVGPTLRVMLATIHVPLMRVGGILTTARVLDSIDLAHRACMEMGIAHPRIAVCGLNPHAGEGGILGEEDQRIIAPAIARARELKIDATGPFPADTIFNAAAAPPQGAGKFDCVVAMYHDQGLIPVKLLDGKKAVNVTVGLPTVRSSPAHGTAFDIAGTNSADPASMVEAIRLAVKMVALRAVTARTTAHTAAADS